MPSPSFGLSSHSATGSITNRAVQFLSNKISNIQSNIQSKFEQRTAVRYSTKVGHKFSTNCILEPTQCSQCHGFIYGWGQRCKFCHLSTHEKCMDLIESRCKKSASSVSKNVDQHDFKPKTYFKPTFCDHCGTLLVGVIDQGMKCRLCETDGHSHCVRLMSNPCNVNSRRDVITSKQIDADSHLENAVEDWGDIRIEDFDLVKIVGVGTFSKVYLAKLKCNNKEFAIKVVKKIHPVVSSDPKSPITEMKVLQFGRQHEFLAIAHCCFQSRDRLYFVMEYVLGRDLLYYLRKERKFTEKRCRFYAAEVFLALDFLHKQGVVYRDLKLDNVILERNGHCKLIDFGMSKELYKSDMRTRTFCGTPSYISPEVIRELDYDFSVDWWALGVLMYEMMVGCSPFEATSEEQLYEAIVSKEPKFPLFLSVEARSILEGLLTKDPRRRLGCEPFDYEQAIKDHPFFGFESEAITDLHLACNSTDHWSAVFQKRVRPPYIPKLEDLEDTDDMNEGTSLTPISCEKLKHVPQAEFNGFTFLSRSFESMVGEKLESPASHEMVTRLAERRDQRLGPLV